MCEEWKGGWYGESLYFLLKLAINLKWYIKRESIFLKVMFTPKIKIQADLLRYLSKASTFRNLLS